MIPNSNLLQPNHIVMLSSAIAGGLAGFTDVRVTVSTLEPPDACAPSAPPTKSVGHRVRGPGEARCSDAPGAAGRTSGSRSRADRRRRHRRRESWARRPTRACRSAPATGRAGRRSAWEAPRPVHAPSGAAATACTTSSSQSNSMATEGATATATATTVGRPSARHARLLRPRRRAGTKSACGTSASARRATSARSR